MCRQVNIEERLRCSEHYLQGAAVILGREVTVRSMRGGQAQ